MSKEAKYLNYNSYRLRSGPGGLFGLGLGNSRQKHFYLPEPQTDFIFSIISEELGFLGCFITILLFLIIIFCGFKIARSTDDLFGKYLSFGITFWISFQALLNLMVVVGLIPVTGPTKLWGTKYYRVKPFKIKEFKF